MNNNSQNTKFTKSIMIHKYTKEPFLALTTFCQCWVCVMYLTLPGCMMALSTWQDCIIYPESHLGIISICVIPQEPPMI